VNIYINSKRYEGLWGPGQITRWLCQGLSLIQGSRCAQDRIEELQAGLARVAEEKGHVEAHTSQLAKQLQVFLLFMVFQKLIPFLQGFEVRSGGEGGGLRQRQRNCEVGWGLSSFAAAQY